MKPDIIIKAQNIINSCEECYFSFINDRGYPETATRSNIKPEGIRSCFFVTGTSGPMAQSLKSRAQSSVCFRKGADNVTLVGDTEIVTDESLRKALWQDWFINHFPEGVEDPEYFPVRFVTSEVSLWIESEQQIFSLADVLTPRSRCGLLCQSCSFVESNNCKGCIATMGNPFYGSCPIAQCCQGKGYEHCGQCPDMPCKTLHDYSCGEGEHCDNPKGARLEILRMWE